MKPLAALLALFSFSIAAEAATLIPSDFFLQPIAGFDPTAGVLRKAPQLVEVEQHFPARSTNGSTMNLMTFCMAIYLAKQGGYAAASVSISSSDPAATSRSLLLSLLNDQEEYKQLDTTKHWTPYLSLDATRSGCSKLVKSTYLW